MARSFNGSSDHIDLSTSNTLNPTPSYSMSAWFICPFVNAYNPVLAKGGAGNGFNLYVKSNKTLAVYSGGTSYDGTGSQVCGTGWNHVAVTINSTSLVIVSYLNGVVDFTSSGAFNTNDGNGTKALEIGGDGGGGHLYGGTIADVAVWNAVLSSAEVIALSKGARPHTIRPLSLVAFWPLDGLQSPEPDLSGGVFNGTLTGTAKAFGPPLAPFTPRWPQFTFVAAPVTPPPVSLMPQPIL
jgi:hypothetical protein